jgi:hypothetical protein
MPPSTTRTVITDDYPVENGGESSVIMVARPVGRFRHRCRWAMGLLLPGRYGAVSGVGN